MRLIGVARARCDVCDRQRRLPSCKHKYALEAQDSIKHLRAVAERGSTATPQLPFAEVEATGECADLHRRRALRGRGNDGADGLIRLAASPGPLAESVFEGRHRADRKSVV